MTELESELESVKEFVEDFVEYFLKTEDKMQVAAEKFGDLLVKKRESCERLLPMKRNNGGQRKLMLWIVK